MKSLGRKSPGLKKSPIFSPFKSSLAYVDSAAVHIGEFTIKDVSRKGKMFGNTELLKESAYTGAI
jgi:hypothetical protein